MLLPGPWSILWLFAGCLSVEAAVQADPNIKSIPLRTHSLASVSYSRAALLRGPQFQISWGVEINGRWFEFGGDTIIRADQYIRLTSDRPSQSGWLFSKLPLTATNWEIEFQFKIHGQGNLHGDGFALWLTKQRATPGPVFGHTDQFEGLGVFFDTYKNNRPGMVFPYVMAMLGDGKTPYDQANDGKANELAGCSARGIRGATQPTKARLTYFQDTSLKLELQYNPDEDWTTCFELGPVAIPSIAYLGFSAETGELSDNFDIIKVDTQNLYSSAQYEGGSKRPAPSTRPGAKDYNPNREQRGGGWTWFLLKVVLFGVLCVGAYVGWTIYRSSRRSSRF